MSLPALPDPDLEALLAELENSGDVSSRDHARRLRDYLVKRYSCAKDNGTERARHSEAAQAAGISPAAEGDVSPREPAPGATHPDFKRLFEGLPGLFLVLDPQLHVVAATDAYLKATLTQRDNIVGRHLFDIFPDNPNDPSADSIRNTRASMQRVIQTKMADVMVVQRHDVRRPETEGGGWEVRYWSPVNSPLLNPDGSIAYISIASRTSPTISC